MFKTLQSAIAPAVETSRTLSSDRLEILKPFAETIVREIESRSDAQITFICTHNSRRSHLAQVWAQTAAAYYGLRTDRVRTYSGGTEATAANIRTVRALRRAGFSIVDSTFDDPARNSNPIYLVQYDEDEPPLFVFSKVYDQDGNPLDNFIAAMCCSDADARCPIVNGAVGRVSLNYRDPKEADDTANESAVYEERSAQIAAEMFAVMRWVAEAVK